MVTDFSSVTRSRKSSRLTDIGAMAAVATLEELTAGARKTADGKVSATDVIMVVKKCTRNNASRILRNLHEEERIPKLEMVTFGSNLDEANPAPSSWGGSRKPEAAADARQIVQVLWALPGDSEFRKNSASVVVRYVGGDPRMVEEVISIRRAQEVLREEQPDHPARFFGETVEREMREDDASLKRKRRETEELELDLRCSAARIGIAKAEGELKKVQIESYLGCFEVLTRAGIPLDDRAKLQLRDMVGSVAGRGATEGCKELCVRSFLLSKKVNPKAFEARFGKIVARMKREELRSLGKSDVLPTKRIESNGQIVEAKLYFEEDAELFDRAWTKIQAAVPTANVKAGRSAPAHASRE